jgi:hypothetical protein
MNEQDRDLSERSDEASHRASAPPDTSQRATPGRPRRAQPAPTELLLAYAERVRRHTNDCHQDELRRFVSQRTGAAEAEIAGVELADLTPSGAIVWFVELAGARTFDLVFPEPARDVAQLGAALRVELDV